MNVCRRSTAEHQNYGQQYSSGQSACRDNSPGEVSAAKTVYRGLSFHFGRSRSVSRDGADETIPAPRQGFDEARIFRRIA